MNTNTKIELNTDRMSDGEFKIYNRALNCNAPIVVAYNRTSQKRRHSSLGSTDVPAKHFVDTRNGRKCSYGQARQIIKKYERLHNESL